ncbi:MAG: NrfD/PsrC family molybdoenzyme membrane anchor subunit [Hyphomicrobiales bacterium]
MSLTENKQINNIETDLLRPITKHRGLKLWVLLLVLVLICAGYFYFVQLTEGLGVTAMRDYVSWGIYISNFVFFVAASLIGMLISAVLGLLKMKWITPITRIAEIIALGFVLVAGLVIISDMGRPDRFPYLFLFGRVQSPIIWDVTVIITYSIISLLLYILPLVPDAALCYQKLDKAPQWQRALYKGLSFRWVGNKEQYRILFKSIRTLFVLVVPVALAIHTVTSWLFASTLRVGWDSTIFGPYFVSGAFVAGCAAVIIAMNFFRCNYKLKSYITELHFNKMGQLMVLVSLIYLYFNINEFLVPGYKGTTLGNIHLHTLFSGSYSILFWLTQGVGLVIPIILLLFRKMRKPMPITIISIVMIIGAWLKRYLIIIPTLLHPHFPIQNVPNNFMSYFPTIHEVFITAGAFAITLIIITILSKIFPIIPVWELKHQAKEEDTTM